MLSARTIMEIASTKTAMIVSAQKRRTPTATLNYKLIDLPNVIVRFAF